MVIAIKNKNNILSVIIDDIDWPRIADKKWWLRSDKYVVTKINNKEIRLHRFLINAPAHLVVDHINGNKLDNRRSNLRTCTIHQNVMNQARPIDNKSGYKGVYFQKGFKWRAFITVNKRKIALGSFDNIIFAAKAYDSAAKYYYGEYAKLNLY